MLTRKLGTRAGIRPKQSTANTFKIFDHPVKICDRSTLSFLKIKINLINNILPQHTNSTDNVGPKQLGLRF
jgi:hypothetical protein